MTTHARNLQFHFSLLDTTNTTVPDDGNSSAGFYKQQKYYKIFHIYKLNISDGHKHKVFSRGETE